MKVTDDKKGLLFKMLAQKSLYDTGVELGFDKHYRDMASVKSAVYRIYQQVRKDPEKYGVNLETAKLVEDVVSSRSIAVTSVNNSPTLREQREALEKADIKELVLTGRQKALKLVHRKLDMIGSSKKRLAEANLSTLAQTFGIIFDKAQIIQGEATENVALLAKIDANLTPDQALEAILKLRETHQEDKDRVKK